ncbi:protein transport protein SEC31 [Diplogelasinospora grovesii]|uniref:Protein transport protein SEC31 n=1 Tax=Diplogelasinospora grovesii TaxID=303347 RepID=A0AAN6S720_9PEZI|nr:protein transport protein SEC31 [Diplogelasinospora grovesii]
MVRLREIPRAAAFAWSPGANPLVATGTRSGAVDADFSDESKLELWDLKLDSQEQGLELHPITSISTESRFYDIAWGAPSDDYPRGVIAGGMENGALELWDADKLIAGAEDALISRTTKHSGPIKSLQFNPLRPQILVTAGAKGEVFVWDINDVSSPFRLGTAAARADDVDCVAWNRKVANILATGGAGGFVTVWDLKTKKASLTLNNNRKPVSAIAWDPNNSTKLLTASSDDNTPVILMWNLRNSQAPEKTLQGHDQGVLSLSWCQQDPGLLVSCGKDNRTLVWNPQTGERYGEFPEVTNWTFMTRFNPHNPNLSATASFDGKITIQTLQNTNPSATPAPQNNENDDDFFSKAPTQIQGPSFSLPRAPTWFERPVGVSFGYGGKLIVFKKDETAAGQHRSSKIQISQFSVDSDLGSATEKFEEAIKSGDIASICETHVANAKTEEEKAEWQVMQTLNQSDGRTKIVEYLGFSKEDATNEAQETETSESKEAKVSSPSHLNGDAPKKHRRITSMWNDGDDGDDFLSELAPAKGAKTDDPFHLLSEGNTALEDKITKAIMLGNFEKAVDICIKEDRIADAFIIANCGGKDLLDKVQTSYLSRRNGGPSYLRLISSVVTKNLWDVAYNADLTDWKETMVTLCTFADPSEFPDLCEALGDRIYESGARKDASFCYLVGSKLEKVVNIWIAELEEAEQAGMQESSDDSTFSVHARSLQQFIEKVTVFRHVTGFADNETNLTSEWKLASLYDKYTEYADIVAAHGQLAVAQKYLDLLPTSYPAAEVARNRVKLATQRAAPRAAPQVAAARQQAAPAIRTSSRSQTPLVGYQPRAPSVGVPAPNPYAASTQPSAPAPVSNPYAPAAPAPASNPYAPPAAAQYQPSAPSPYAPQGQSYAPAPAIGGYGAPSLGYNQPSAHGPPPRSTAPPPKVNKDVGQWNDVPMVVTKPPTRKTTPSVAPITSPFPGGPSLASPPPVGAYQRSAPTPPPPPPKGSAPPRNTASPFGGPPQAGQQQARSSSVASATSPYAPPPPVAPAGMAPPPMMPQTVPRTASPYNPPPAGAPPSSRYAPAPAAQQFNQGPASSPLAPPPSNSYAPAPSQAGASAPNPYAAPPPARTPVGPPPASGPPPAARAPAGPPPRATPPPAAASKPRHPAGDRSHIPPNAQELVNILSQDMQRVATKAPASFAPQVKDTQKRLGLLFDHLNNEELIKPDTIDQLSQLAGALAARNYDVATRLQVEIQRDKTEECGQWMVGVKRLIVMSKATP